MISNVFNNCKKLSHASDSFDLLVSVPAEIIGPFNDTSINGVPSMYHLYIGDYTWFEALEKCPTWVPGARLAQIWSEDTFDALEPFM